MNLSILRALDSSAYINKLLLLDNQDWCDICGLVEFRDVRSIVDTGKFVGCQLGIDLLINIDRS